MALRNIQFPLLIILLACTVTANDINTDTTTPPQLVPEGGTDHLYPIVNLGAARLKWSHGAFISNEASSHYFFTLNTDGEVTQKAYLQEPEDSQYWIRDFDRKSDGTIVAAAVPRDDEASPFLAWIAPDGTTERIVPTAPYFPSMLAIAEDGTVWTLGYESIHQRVDDPNLDPNDGVLRQFDSNGHMIASALPQRDFIGSKIRELARLGVSGKLCSFEKHLVWYSSVNGNAKFVEIPVDKIELHVLPGVPKQFFGGLPMQIEGFTVMGTHDAAVSLVGPGKFVTFVLDHTSEKWVPVTVPPFGASAASRAFRPKLIGSEGDHLVFSYKTSAEFFSIVKQQPNTDSSQ